MAAELLRPAESKVQPIETTARWFRASPSTESRLQCAQPVDDKEQQTFNFSTPIIRDSGGVTSKQATRQEEGWNKMVWGNRQVFGRGREGPRGEVNGLKRPRDGPFRSLGYVQIDGRGEVAKRRWRARALSSRKDSLPSLMTRENLVQLEIGGNLRKEKKGSPLSRAQGTCRRSRVRQETKRRASCVWCRSPLRHCSTQARRDSTCPSAHCSRPASSRRPRMLRRSRGPDRTLCDC